jgi:hypothetical protein
MAQARQQQERGLNNATKQFFNAASGAARTGVDAAAGTAQAGTDTLQRTAETTNQMWESESKMAGQFIEQSMQQFARTFGMAGESAQQQASRGLDSIIQTGTVLSNGMQTVSRELFNLANRRLDENLYRANSLLRCRTPQEMIAEYGGFIRDNMEEFAQSTRRIMELSTQIADEAARRLMEPMQKVNALAPREPDIRQS